MFEELYGLNVNDHTETLKQGRTELTYLSWTWAWAEIKKRYENAEYSIHMYTNGEGSPVPYMFDPNTGYMVMTTVTIDGISHDMWLPVMDGANKAMKAEPYTYKVKEYQNGRWSGEYTEKTVEAATMFDVNKTIMRCLVKNLAMFGLGLYIYAREDLPETDAQPASGKPKKDDAVANGELITKKAKLKSMMTQEQWDAMIDKFGVPTNWTEDQVDKWTKQLEEKNA